LIETLAIAHTITHGSHFTEDFYLSTLSRPTGAHFSYYFLCLAMIATKQK